MVLAAGLCVVLLGMVFAALTRGTRLTSSGMARMGTAQGVVTLRTHLQRDLARVTSLDQVSTAADPDRLVIEPGNHEVIVYFLLDGELYRQVSTLQGAEPAVRIGQNFQGTLVYGKDEATGQVRVSVEGTTPFGAPQRGAHFFQQGYTLADATAPLHRYYCNWVVAPPGAAR